MPQEPSEPHPRGPEDAHPSELRVLDLTPLEDEPLAPDPSHSGPDPRVLADLMHPRTEVRLETLRRLRDEPAGVPVVAVTARLKDPEPRVREAAVTVLQSMGDERLLLLLLDAMRDPTERVRQAARRGILDRAGPSLIELLRRELAVPARAAPAAALLAEMDQGRGLLRAMEDADPAVRSAISEALQGSGSTERLIEDLGHRRSDRRRVAAEQLGIMESRQAVDALTERLEDPDRGVRMKAAEALGRIGDLRATDALKRSLVSDPDPGVAVAVGLALRRLTGGGDPGTIRP